MSHFGDKKPQSDGIRRRIISPARSEPRRGVEAADVQAYWTSNEISPVRVKDDSTSGGPSAFLPEKKRGPHEEGGDIIITESVSDSVSEPNSIPEPLLESVVLPEIESTPFPREEDKSRSFRGVLDLVGRDGRGSSNPEETEEYLKKRGKSYEKSQNTFFFESKPLSRIRENRPLWWGLFGGLGMVLILGILLSTVFARLTITLKPRVDTLNLQDTLLLMDASVSRPLLEQKVIPAERLEFNKKITGEFESTGREYIEEKARGKVKIYNRFSSSPQTLVVGTRFLIDSGALYRLAKTIIITGAKIEEGKIIPESVETELIADKAGEEGNLNGEFTLKIPGLKGTAKYEGFYAVASGGFSGGFKGEVRVVSKEDLKKAEEQVTRKLYEELQQEMARKIPPDFKVIDSLREIQVTKLDSPRPNSRGDRFSVETVGQGRLIVFREADSVAVLKGIVIKDDTAIEYINGSADLQYQVRTVDFEKGRAEVVVRGSLKAKATVPKKELAEIVRSKKEGSIVEVLKSRNELAAFNVVFFPPWLSKAPPDLLKIRFIEK